MENASTIIVLEMRNAARQLNAMTSRTAQHAEIILYVKAINAQASANVNISSRIQDMHAWIWVNAQIRIFLLGK
jgi:hypothetical protein